MIMGRKEMLFINYFSTLPRVLLGHPPFSLSLQMDKGSPLWLSNRIDRTRGSQGSWSSWALLSVSHRREAGLHEISITYFPLAEKGQVISFLLGVWDSSTRHLNKSRFQLTLAQRPGSCGWLFLSKWEMKASRINKAF